MLWEATFLSYGNGFYSRETGGTDEWRWSQKKSSLTIANPSDRPRQINFSATLRGNGTLQVKAGHYSRAIQLLQEGSSLNLPLNLPPKTKATIEFRFEGPRVNSGPDTRQLFFNMMNPRID